MTRNSHRPSHRSGPRRASVHLVALLTAAVAFVVLPAATAQAETVNPDAGAVSFTGTANTLWINHQTAPISIDPFDTSLGTLTGVKVTATTKGVTDTYIPAGSVQATIPFDTSGTFTSAALPSAQTISVHGWSDIQVIYVGLCEPGIPIEQCPPTRVYASGTASGTILDSTAPATLTGFTGSAPITFNVDAVSAPYGAYSNPISKISQDASLSVTYTYTPKAVDPQTHTVTFDANGGAGVMDAQTASGPTALSANSFTFSGHEFSGWNTVADGSGVAYADKADFPFDVSATLYAQWTPVAPSTHTVTFDANGGAGVMDAQTASGPTALSANSFTFSGHEFSGWNTVADGSGVAYADKADFPFDVSATLYAQWTPVAPQPTELTDAMAGLESSSYVYTGAPIKPTVTVTDSATTLQEGTDYTVSYGSNTTVAQGGSVTVTGIGDYTGSVVVPFAITAKPITVTADNQTKVAGADDPDLTWSAPGLVPGDTLTGSLTYTGSQPGTYDIVQDQPFANPNYAITFVKGTMTISPAPWQPVVAMINALPSQVIDGAGAEQVARATEAFNGLNPIDQVMVPSTVVDALHAAQQQAGVVDHTDAVHGATVSAGEVPWDVRLSLTPITSTDARYGSFVDSLGGADLLALYDVSFTRLLTGAAWEPAAGQSVSIALSKEALSGRTGVAVWHQRSGGSLEQVESSVADGVLTFTGSSFSLYGVTADRAAGPNPGTDQPGSGDVPGTDLPSNTPVKNTSQTTKTSKHTAAADTLPNTGAPAGLAAELALALLALLAGAGLLTHRTRGRRDS